MSVMSNPQSHHFQLALKSWRNQRKISQLDLALAADVSQRHISWLETGRSKPSRAMVLRLSDAMDIPLRDRNQILNLAGYANVYTEHDLSEPAMESVMGVLSDVLIHHEPFPAFVFDRRWNLKMKNQAADKLFSIMGEPSKVWRDIGDTGKQNMALLTVHPNGLRRIIKNWPEIITPFMHRLKKEAIASGDKTIMADYARLVSHIDVPNDQAITPHLLPVLPLEISLGDINLKLCSVISTFGTAQDITTDGLRIETFYPVDAQTRRYFSAWTASA